MTTRAMTAERLYFINRNRNIQKKARTELDNLTINELKDKVIQLQRDLGKANTKIAYLERLEALRRKAVVEFGLAYEVAYSKYEKALTTILQNMSNN